MLYRISVPIVISLVISTSISCSSDRENLFAKYDFETGDFQDLRTEKLRYDYSGQISDRIARGGNYSVRFELRRGDETDWEQGSRAELKDNYNAPMNTEIWYGISIYIPHNFPELDNNCVLAQWHGDHDEGEVSRSPVFALRLEKNILYFTSRSSNQKIQNSNSASEITHFTLNDFPRDEWLDIVVEAFWSYEDNGALKAWLNGEQIIDYKGPIGYNDDLGPYFKFGLYKHSGDDPLVVFADEYRRGGSMKEVDPARYSR